MSVQQEKSYPQIAGRAFGRGTFHKPALEGSEVTWEKPFRVEAGDILISNIKAWEGAIAVAPRGLAPNRAQKCPGDWDRYIMS